MDFRPYRRKREAGVFKNLYPRNNQVFIPSPHPLFFSVSVRVFVCFYFIYFIFEMIFESLIRDIGQLVWEGDGGIPIYLLIPKVPKFSSAGRSVAYVVSRFLERDDGKCITEIWR